MYKTLHECWICFFCEWALPNGSYMIGNTAFCNMLVMCHVKFTQILSRICVPII